MNERASLAGGALTLLSAPGRGTRIEAIFPLSNPVSPP
jgi:signal transduction histidine kinase